MITHDEDLCPWYLHLRQFYDRQFSIEGHYGECTVCGREFVRVDGGLDLEDMEFEACADCWTRIMAIKDGVHRPIPGGPQRLVKV